MTTVRVWHATDADARELQAIEDDADRLFATLLDSAGWATAPPGEDRLRAAGYILVASEAPGTEPLGFVHVLEVVGGDHLEQLSVRLSAMGRGIGRALVESAQRESVHRCAHRLTLRTFAEVPWNAPFYETCGFVESHPDTDFLRGLVDAEGRLGLADQGRRVQMTCSLASPDLTSPDLTDLT